jgi:hypothetical protein
MVALAANSRRSGPICRAGAASDGAAAGGGGLVVASQQRARRLRAGQARPARAALRRRIRLLSPVRIPLWLQARAPMARLPAGLALFRPLPLRRPPGRLPPLPRPQRLPRRRRRGIATIHPRAALQLSDPQLQLPDQLSLACLPRLQRRPQRRDLGVLGLDHPPQPGIRDTQGGQLVPSPSRLIRHTPSSPAHPVPQARLADSRVAGNLGDRRITLTGEFNRTLPELKRVGRGHDGHPSR